MNKKEIDLHLPNLIKIHGDTINNVTSLVKEIEIIVDLKTDMHLLLTLRDTTRVFVKYKFITVDSVKQLEYFLLGLFTVLCNITNKIHNRKYSLWGRILGKHHKKEDYLISFITTYNYNIYRGGRPCLL